MSIFHTIRNLFWKPKAYLSGPMTGVKDLNVPAFNKYAKQLRNQGYKVFNPASDISNDRTESMKLDIRALTEAKVVFVMPGWVKSKGAMIECFIAQALSIPILDADTQRKVNVDLGIMPTPASNYPDEMEDITVDKAWEWYESFVTNEDGSIDMPSLKNELFDAYFVLMQVSKVYCHITGGSLSKPLYYSSTVIREYEKHLEDHVEEVMRDRDEYEKNN